MGNKRRGIVECIIIIVSIFCFSAPSAVSYFMAKDKQGETKESLLSLINPAPKAEEKNSEQALAPEKRSWTGKEKKIFVHSGPDIRSAIISAVSIAADYSSSPIATEPKLFPTGKEVKGWLQVTVEGSRIIGWVFSEFFGRYLNDIKDWENSEFICTAKGVIARNGPHINSALINHLDIKEKVVVSHQQGLWCHTGKGWVLIYYLKPGIQPPGNK